MDWLSLNSWPLWAQVAAGVLVALAIWALLKAIAKRGAWKVALVWLGVTLAALVLLALGGLDLRGQWIGFRYFQIGTLALATLAGANIVIPAMNEFGSIRIEPGIDRSLAVGLFREQLVRTTLLLTIAGSLTVALGGFAFRAYASLSPGTEWFFWVWN